MLLSFDGISATLFAITLSYTEKRRWVQKEAYWEVVVFEIFISLCSNLHLIIKFGLW